MLYQMLRWICLALSFGLLLVVPLWNLAAIDDAGAGLAGGGRWAGLAETVVPPTIAPPLVGTLWSIDVLGIEIMDPLAGLSLLATGRADLAVLIAVLPAMLPKTPCWKSSLPQLLSALAKRLTSLLPMQVEVWADRSRMPIWHNLRIF